MLLGTRRQLFYFYPAHGPLPFWIISDSFLTDSQNFPIHNLYEYYANALLHYVSLLLFNMIFNICSNTFWNTNIAFGHFVEDVQLGQKRQDSFSVCYLKKYCKGKLGIWKWRKLVMRRLNASNTWKKTSEVISWGDWLVCRLHLKVVTHEREITFIEAISWLANGKSSTVKTFSPYRSTPLLAHV